MYIFHKYLMVYLQILHFIVILYIYQTYLHKTKSKGISDVPLMGKNLERKSHASRYRYH